MTARTDIRSIEIDCHTFPWHDDPEGRAGYGEDDQLPTMVGLAETYGVLVEHLADHPLAGWAWWYRLTGPGEHLRRLLAEEYAGGYPEADEMLT